MFVRGIDFTSVLFIRFFDWNMELFHTSVLYPRFSDWNLELFHTSVLYPRFSDWNFPEKTTDLPQVTDKLYLSHNVVSSTPRLSGNRIIRGIMFISQEWHKRAEKTSLLTASGVL
jgi:hypothetical protein